MTTQNDNPLAKCSQFFLSSPLTPYPYCHPFVHMMFIIHSLPDYMTVHVAILCIDLTALWLRSDCALTALWPRSDRALTALWPRSDRALTALWPRSDCALTALWLCSLFTLASVPRANLNATASYSQLHSLCKCTNLHVHVWYYERLSKNTNNTILITTPKVKNWGYWKHWDSLLIWSHNEKTYNDLYTVYAV